jgi:hypothetical protein
MIRRSFPAQKLGASQWLRYAMSFARVVGVKLIRAIIRLS